MERAVPLMNPRQGLPANLPLLAFEAGDMSTAQTYAQRVLDDASRLRFDYGNAIHKGNLVLGRIAVREGRIADAVKFLRASVEMSGSPSLNSFGPNMTLAKDLLENGDPRATEAVLAYFELCRKFWTLGNAKLDYWTDEVRAGRVPDFGANLLY
jgi:hypothetical protein